MNTLRPDGGPVTPEVAEVMGGRIHPAAWPAAVSAFPLTCLHFVLPLPGSYTSLAYTSFIHQGMEAHSTRSAAERVSTSPTQSKNRITQGSFSV
jgi:hypothetical protein